MPTDHEMIEAMWLWWSVPQEDPPYLIDLVVEDADKDDTISGQIDTLSDYLHSSLGLGDIRFNTSALYIDLITGGLMTKIDNIISYVQPGDDGNAIGEIRVNTDNIPTIISDITAIAGDVIEIGVGVATVESGVGVLLLAGAGVELVLDAIQLQNDLIKTETDKIPDVETGIAALDDKVDHVQEGIDELLGMVPEVETMYKRITDTDNDQWTLTLDKVPNYDRPHMQTGELGFKWFTDYLVAMMRSNPPAGYYEEGTFVEDTGTFVFDITGAYGVKLEVDEVPEWVGRSTETPYRYTNLAYISFGRMGGYDDYKTMIFNPTVIMPLPAGVESIRIESVTAATMKVTRIIPTGEA